MVVDALYAAVAGLIGDPGHGRERDLVGRRIGLPGRDGYLLAEQDADILAVFLREAQLDGIFLVSHLEFRDLEAVDGGTQGHADLGGAHP